MALFENVYYSPFYQKIRREYDRLFDEKYFDRTEEYAPGGGYSLITRHFEERTLLPDGKLERVLSCSRSALKNSGGEELFSFDCLYGGYPFERTAKIFTAAGEEYFFFKEDLYGYSVLRLCDKSVMRYMPEGYKPENSEYLGESFIITDMQFFGEYSFAVCGGCFWAAPSDVYICDLSEPMTEPRDMPLITDIIDPHGDMEAAENDVNFKEYKDGKFVFTAETNSDDGEICKEYSFTGKYLQQQVRKIKSKL